ncbi:MAG: hypothetical protein OHK0023_24050 [Anaerolineae bacterium]
MTRAVRTYLHDLLYQIDHLERFTQGGEAAFRQSALIQYAVRHAYEIIGEVVKRLPEDLLATQPNIRWRDIKGLWDIIIHQYHRIELDPIWAAVQDLPNLKAAIEAMLRTLPPPETEERHE